MNWVKTMFQRLSLLGRQWLDRNLMLPATKLDFFSFIYSHLFASCFSREIRAVMAGRRMYESAAGLDVPLGTNYLLRRNIHRIEKALIRNPRKKVFAEDYICQTVSAYRIFCELLKEQSSSELQWAFDVLRRYFEVVNLSPLIEKAKKDFESISPLNGKHSEGRLIPQARGVDSRPVEYRALLELANRRRSVRHFLQRPVKRDLIDKAFEVARLSPSACNRQPFEFLVFDEPAMVRKVAEIPVGTQGFAENFPAIVVLIGRLRAFSLERDRHVIYIDGSLAAMSFMLALETVGLSSCPINWPDISEKEVAMSKLLNLELDERIIMLIAIGEADPAGQIPASAKKSLKQVRSYNLGREKIG